MQRVPWFACFSLGMRQQFINQGRFLSLSKGELLCRQNDVVDSLCLVIDGTLDINFSTAQGKRHIVTHLEPGQIMNLIPVMDGQRAIHNAYAHEDVLVLLIPAALYRANVQAHAESANAILHLMCTRSRLLYETVSDNALLSLRARCARLLLSLLSSYGLPRAQGMAISLKLSQFELADMLGTSRQSVNKELKALEREGLIQMTYSHFIVRNQQLLQEIVQQAL